MPLLVVINFGVISREERYLEREFGDAYRAYKSRVRRWL
jgi:protein-S-isoprenylcysteine O-methyltransferase Ste14